MYVFYVAQTNVAVIVVPVVLVALIVAVCVVIATLLAVIFVVKRKKSQFSFETFKNLQDKET